MEFSLNFALIATLFIFAFAINGYTADCPDGTADRPGACWWNAPGKIQLQFIKLLIFTKFNMIFRRYTRLILW